MPQTDIQETRLTLLVLLMCSFPNLIAAGVDLPDPTSVPAEQRIAVLNKLFESREGAETDGHYHTALKRHVGLWDKGAFGTPEPEPKADADAAAADWLNANEYALLVRFDWPSEHVAHVDRWLKANADALAALRQAVGGQRWYRPFAAESGRLADIDLVGEAAKLRMLAKLRALAAARLAYEGRWDEAAGESASNLRLAAHVRERPLVLWQGIAGSLEDIAFAQLSALVPHLPPEGLKRLGTTYRAAQGTPQPSDEQIAFAELLYTWDTIERYHEWARDESRHPSVREQLSTFLSMHDTLNELRLDQAGLKVEQPSFESVDAFKAALLKSTPQAAWKVVTEHEAAYREWAALPLPEALPKLAAFGERSRQIGRKDPIMRLFDEISLFRPGHFRLLRATRDARRAGFEVLLALHQFKAENKAWPTRLEELTPKLLVRLPEDPYSGKPLVYRRSADGADFVLYSVGENQKDDAGRRPADEGQVGAALSGDVVFWPLETPEFKQP